MAASERRAKGEARAPKQAAKPAPNPAGAREAGDAVRVRMYRGILGDCFLIRHATGGTTRHMLIDCGALQNVKQGGGTSLAPEVVKALGDRRATIADSDARIRLIAADVARTVKADGGQIDRLVVTHEHYDHLSGFAVAREVWADPELRVAELWLAWTEDPDDARARALQDGLAKGRSALALAMRVAAFGAAEDEALADAVALGGFLGPLDVAGESGAGGKMTTRQTIGFLKEKAAKVRYLQPGTVLTPAEGIGLATYVLGPPKADARLTKSAPSGGSRSEVYLTGRDEAASVERSARRRLLGMAKDAAHPFEMDGEMVTAWDAALEGEAAPFARPHWSPYDAAERGFDPDRRCYDPARARHPDPKAKRREPSPELARLIARYEAADESYRVIDEDLGAFAGGLALKMDSDTNNTSLALALEMPGGDVLLFPGDAQVGNWLSWGDQRYPATARPEEQQGIEDILRRVVFYKVGHHASHNATLRERGLALMTNPRLSAAIPLVEAVAEIQGPGRKTPGRGWKMPYGNLYAELKERTRGRIVRGDGDPAVERDAFRAAPTDAAAPVAPEYDGSKDDLWVELVFPLTGQEEAR